MYSIPLFLKKRFPGFKVLDLKEWLSEGFVEVILEPSQRQIQCHRCGHQLDPACSKHQLKLQDLPIMNLKCIVKLWRFKGYCQKCKKYRSQKISFICPESPHLTAEFGWWLGRLCEIASVSNAADLSYQDAQTLWRHDFDRMKRMLQFYKIPALTALSVDEVYAKATKENGETRNDLFFTVISDLKTRKVIFVTQGRSKQALDQFYILLGPEACNQIEVVAMDQFDGYFNSTKQYCPKATIVWDRFHLMKTFTESLNETRKDLHAEASKGTPLQKNTAGQYRYIFIKKESRRTLEEKQHIDEVVAINKRFSQLEIIKERMFSFFNSQSVEEAKLIFQEIGDWMWQAQFKPLMKWYINFEKGWETVKNYFLYKVTSSLSEGINTVIKMLKRRAFGYRNMEYFRLKIMQKCGYLNSKFIPLNFQE